MDKFINLQLFGIDYYVCDICKESFPDVIDYYYCATCDKNYCSDECAEEADLKYTYYKDGDEVTEDDDYDYEEIISCKYCRNEDFTDEDVLKYLLEKHNETLENVKEEMKLKI